jgi:Sulfotransferase domain
MDYVMKILDPISPPPSFFPFPFSFCKFIINWGEPNFWSGTTVARRSHASQEFLNFQTLGFLVIHPPVFRELFIGALLASLLFVSVQLQFSICKWLRSRHNNPSLYAEFRMSSSTLSPTAVKWRWALAAALAATSFLIAAMYLRRDFNIETVIPRRRMLQNIRNGRRLNASSLLSTKEQLSNVASRCDLLPLRGGHFHWDENTETSTRIHTSNDTICGPKVLIIGAMKCGTNTLGQLVAKHPRVQINRCQAGQSGCNVTAFQGSVAPFDDIWEGNDFTHRVFEVKESKCCAWLDHIDTGSGDYFDDGSDDVPQFLSDLGNRLPWTDGISSFAMDKSPSYLDISQFPKAAKIAKRYLPNAKILATVCDPSLRMVSHYFHSSTKIPEVLEDFYTKHNVTAPSSFLEFVNLLFQPLDSLFCQQHGDFCRKNRILFLEKGQYAAHLAEWHNVYGKENVLVVNMKGDQAKIVQSILELVGSDLLPLEEYPWEELIKPDVAYQNQAYEGRSSAYEKFPNIMRRLQKYYYLHNQELATMLHADFPLAWNRKADNEPL